MTTQKEIQIPDIGDFSDVEIIEVLVQPGDAINKEDSLITVESDKASMEIPSPESGVIKELIVGIGDRVSQGDVILTMDLADEGQSAQVSKQPEAAASESDGSASFLDPLSAQREAAVEAPEAAPTSPIRISPQQPKQEQSRSIPLGPPVVVPSAPAEKTSGPPARAIKPSPTAHLRDEQIKTAHASPAVRRFARELGADLGEIKGSGPKGRILKTDIQEHIKRSLAAGAMGFKVAEMPEVDFSKYGEIEVRPLTRINKQAASNLHRNWVRIPHVTQYDEADITELEDFRKSLNKEYQAKGTKVTILTFLMKAVVSALKRYPRFNTSLDYEQENLIFRHYYHIAVAVDTPEGLVVPVIREVDRKSLIEIASELSEVSNRAREGRLSPTEMQGGCFSISSLGGIGGSAFTPIVNAPQVAILGVSRAAIRPVYKDGEFVPRLILPLSLSYDHRVIDGAHGARFTSFLSAVLSDTRRMLL